MSAATNENELGKIIVDCAFQLHKALGPGLLESVYEVALANELQNADCASNGKSRFPLFMTTSNSTKDSGRTSWWNGWSSWS